MQLPTGAQVYVIVVKDGARMAYELGRDTQIEVETDYWDERAWDDRIVRSWQGRTEMTVTGTFVQGRAWKQGDDFAATRDAAAIEAPQRELRS